ncbi:ABC transporter ATP-binding protein [Devosia sp.]|uniref:ABC transporter ATP-binding protein n=1 Tax=Devosia sp. TaxID=1871048 RepID=UPI002AFE6F05|nr:ABC transporter ATP-binding protein [Devosia sp.]
MTQQSMPGMPPSGQPAGDIMVQVRNLTKTFQTKRGEVTALSHVSLDVHRGEVLVLLGPSGCGKTTLLRCVAGLEHPTSGEISVHGQSVFSSASDTVIPPEKRNLSMVFQSYALWPHMTVAENVGYPLKVSKVDKREIAERVHAVLATTGLEKFGANYPGQLSGGQQQRVALARALVANDGLVLFDEPLSNLDAKVRERLRDELIEMQQQFGFTAIYVTHDQIEAAALAHRIALLEVGKVAQLGDPVDIFSAPRSRYVADFVGYGNELPGTVAAIEGDAVSVQTPIGPMQGVAAGAELKPGAPVAVMFRPEHCEIVDAASAGANIFKGRVEQSIFLGSYLEYRLNIAGQKLAVRSMHATRLANGTELTIAINPRATGVFAAPSGA